MTDRIEELNRKLRDYEDALKNLREYAESQGLDTTAYVGGRPAPTREQVLRAVERVGALAHEYWVAQEVGPDRTWGANLYEIIRTAPREAQE